ncbi:UNKNOWN [Stylonychia lemnae]|uniref:Uncharacterized protein n=1 Tax=Stylonychia lemnae TaxID=5949 RepID=A0A077ZXU3_STYLE|nr:UNKNOWN [Stylonychia lemnae]|eukprot:CDW74720.1 UNKNOWN [Stylonychia lemnae]
MLIQPDIQSDISGDQSQNPMQHTGKWGSVSQAQTETVKDYVTLSDEKAFKYSHIDENIIKITDQAKSLLKDSIDTVSMNQIQEEKETDPRSTSDFKNYEIRDKDLDEKVEILEVNDTFYNSHQRQQHQNYQRVKSTGIMKKQIRKIEANKENLELLNKKTRNHFDQSSIQQSKELLPLQSPIRSKITKLKDITNIVNDPKKLQFTFFNEEQQSLNGKLQQLQPLKTTEGIHQSGHNQAFRRNKIVQKALSRSPNILPDYEQHLQSSSIISTNGNSIILNQGSFSVQDQYNRSKEILPKQAFNPSQAFGLYGDNMRSVSSIPPRMGSNDSANRQSIHHMNGPFQRRQTLNDTFSQERWKQQSSQSSMGNGSIVSQYGITYGQQAQQQQMQSINKFDIVEKIRISYEIIQNREKQQQTQNSIKNRFQINTAAESYNFVDNRDGATSRNLKYHQSQMQSKESQQNSVVIKSQRKGTYQDSSNSIYKLNIPKRHSNAPLPQQQMPVQQQFSSTYEKSDNYLNQTFLKLPQITKGQSSHVDTEINTKRELRGNNNKD